MAIPQALAIGIGAPIMTAALTMFTKEDVRAYWRFFGISALATVATAAVVSYLMPAPTAPAIMAVPRQMSVSGVTAQLGRYAGGIRYPGQLTGATGMDGSLIYID